jgi:predicted kinase
MTKGLPGSGKSTWAATTGHVVVNKDDIRERRCRPWSPQEEGEVLKIRDREIGIQLSKGGTVISSDTNFAPKHEARFRALCKKYQSEFEIVDFTQVPIEVCIERDAAREDGQGKVGEAVIRKMANTFMPPKVDFTPYTPLPEAPAAILVDIDGTMALMDGRGPYETEKAASDLPNWPILELVEAMAVYAKIIYMSGRDAKFRNLTLDWLSKWGVSYDGVLHMRPEGDTRNDSIVKLELFNTHIRDKFNVKFVLDDRDRVVEMWRKLGLTCLQVAYGNF